MNSNELTFNELSAADFLPNDWGHIDISGLANFSDDEEVCFKLNVWFLQCKYADLVTVYINHIEFGAETECMLNDLVTFKRGLEILNRYNPRDIELDGIEFNTITYDKILDILQILHKKL